MPAVSATMEKGRISHEWWSAELNGDSKTALVDGGSVKKGEDFEIAYKHTVDIRIESRPVHNLKLLTRCPYRIYSVVGSKTENKNLYGKCNHN